MPRGPSQDRYYITKMPLEPAPTSINVLFILNSLCVGGAEKQVVSLINRLDRGRYAVSLLYLKADHTLLDQIDQTSCINGIHCLGLDKGVRWSAVRAIARHIDSKQIHVVVCTNMFALLYGWLARAFHRRTVRLIEVFHTTEIYSQKEQLQMLLYKPLVRLSDLLVYVCHGQAHYWRGRGLRARRDVVIYNGIDTRSFEDVWSADEKLALRNHYGVGDADYLVGLCATMRPEKAHSDLLPALARLRERGLNVKGLLIGDGPERARIEREVRALGLADHVRITGLINDVRPAVAACDVMVLTSHAVETFSIAALEAMTLGKPMVMTDIGGAREQVTQGENGSLYPAGDTEALAERLSAFADEHARRAAGSQAARRVREKFDVSAMVAGYEQALAAIVGEDLVRGQRAVSALRNAK